jgi:hypothetical protein
MPFHRLFLGPAKAREPFLALQVYNPGASVWRHLRGWISLRCGRYLEAATIFGQPLYAESTGGNASIVANIPGMFKFARVFNPESNPENNTAVVGVLRASFTF